MHTEGLLLSKNVHRLPIILEMRLCVNNYHGISVGTVPSSSILFDPPIPEARQLETWLKDNTSYVGRIVSDKLYEKAHQPKAKPSATQIRKISQILSLPETVKSFWIKSTLQVIKPG